MGKIYLKTPLEKILYVMLSCTALLLFWTSERISSDIFWWKHKKINVVKSCNCMIGLRPKHARQRQEIFRLVKWQKKCQTLSVFTALSIRTQKWYILQWCRGLCMWFHCLWSTTFIHSFIHSFIHWRLWNRANDLVMHLKVRLLSCGKVLPKNLLGEIHFPGQRGETPVRVGCPTLDQTFGPSNITCHRIALNLQLQGREINFTWDKPEWHIAFEKQNSCSESISYQSTTWFNSSPKRRFSTSLKKNPSPCGSHSQPSLSSALPIELLWKETAESQTNQNLKVELTATLGHFWSLLLTACKRNDVLLWERRHIWVLNHQYNPEETETDAMHSLNASQGFLQTMKIIMITGMPLSRVHTNAKARQSLLIQASQVQNQNKK